MYTHTLPTGREISMENLLKISPACQSLSEKEMNYVKRRVLELPDDGQKQIAEILVSEEAELQDIERKVQRLMLKMDVLEGRIEKVKNEKDD